MVEGISKVCTVGSPQCNISVQKAASTESLQPKKEVSFKDAVFAELEKVRGAIVEPPKPKFNIPGISELISYQNRVSKVHLGVELVSRCADSLMHSVRRLQQGS